MMKNPDLHGNVPDHSRVALLLIDVINDLDFPEADQFLPHGLHAAKHIAELKARARQADIPVVYVNDNFGKWRSDFKTQLQHCLKPGCLGREIAELLHPEPDDYFVLKPKNSGFYSTTLDLLLRYLQSEVLIITGFAGNNCVFFTASDAYMRDFKIHVPADCIASNTVEENQHALQQMQEILKANIQPSSKLDLRTLQSGGQSHGAAA